LEPSPFAYREGLDALAGRVAASGHPATLGVVVRPAARHLDPHRLEEVRRHGVLCHGLEHRGETIVGTSATIAAGIRAARAARAPAAGFRGPRRARPAARLRALDGAGCEWAPSYPDADRENVACFGGGVRLTAPFRPPIEDGDGRGRTSRCLELPVSAP